MSKFFSKFIDVSIKDILIFANYGKDWFSIHKLLPGELDGFASGWSIYSDDYLQKAKKHIYLENEFYVPGIEYAELFHSEITKNVYRAINYVLCDVVITLDLDDCGKWYRDFKLSSEMLQLAQTNSYLFDRPCSTSLNHIRIMIQQKLHSINSFEVRYMNTDTDEEIFEWEI